MRAHEAGWAARRRAPSAARRGCAARRRQRAGAARCGRRPRARSTARSRSAGSTVDDLVARARHAGVRPRRGRLPRPRPGLPRGVRRATTSTTPARRSSARPSPAGSPRRGSASTSAPAASSPSRCGPGSTPARIGFHGNNKSVAELRARVELGVGRIIVDSFDEIERLAAIAAELGRAGAGDGPGDRRRRGAHARVHRHRARGPEVRLLDHRRRRARGRAPRSQAAAALELLGLHSHIGSQIFDTVRLRGRRPPGARPARPGLRASSASSCPSSTSAAASASPTRPRTTRPTRRELAAELTKIVERRVRGRSAIDVPRLSIEPGRAIVGPAMFTVYEVGTVKAVDARRRRVAHLRLRRRRDERQHPHRALRRRLLLHAGLARVRRARSLLARVVGKHCEAGDIVVKDEFLPGDVAPGDLLAVPGTGAYCRSMASNYNHALRPPVVAVRDGVATRHRPPRDRGRPARARTSAADRRVDVAMDEPVNATRTGPSQARAGGAARLRRRRQRGRAAAHASRPTTSTARVGAPVELVGIAVRRLGRDRDVEVPARAAHHRRRGPGRPRRRRRRRRGDRRHRAGPLADPRRAGERRLRRHRQQGAARRGRRDPVRGRREGRPRPLLRGRRRRRDPDPAAAARVARRRPGHPGARHRQRHHQLHPRQDGHLRRRLRRGARGGPGARATPRPTRPPTSRASTPPRRPRSWPAWRSTPGSPPPTCTARASPRSPRADVAVGARDGLRRQAARDLRADRRRPTDRRSRRACTRR